VGLFLSAQPVNNVSGNDNQVREFLGTRRRLETREPGSDPEPGSVLQIEPGSFFRTRFASFSEGGDGPNGVNLVQTPNQVQVHRGA